MNKGVFLLFTGLLSLTNVEAPKMKGNVKIIEQSDSSTINNMCLWFNITNKEFTSDSSKCVLEWKKSPASLDVFTSELLTVTNINGGIYYYSFVPLECQSVRIVSKNNSDKTICSTKWKSYLYNARLYEVYDNSDILRCRCADVYPPDANVLSFFLSNYYSCSDSYENGKGAFKEIKEYWINYYFGNSGGTLESFYFYDYGAEKGSEKNGKTRLISAREKLNELEESTIKQGIRKDNTKIVLIELLFFVLTLGISFVIAMLLKRKRLLNNNYDENFGK